MENWLKRLKRPWARIVIRLTFLFSIFACTSFALLIFYAKMAGAPPLNVPVNNIYYDNNESIIAKSGQDGINREWVSLEDISEHLIEATIAIEDKRFYSHHGFDFRRIAAAALADIKARSKVQGASTITMQYAKNMFLGHEKTWERKLKEVLYTLRLELNYSKDEILEGYLNTIYYGHGAYGIEEAANYYFQKSANELTLAESSMLAGIPKGPSYYSPKIAFENAKSRQEIVLEAMSQNGFISDREVAVANTDELEFKHDSENGKAIAPYFLDAVQEALITEVGLHPQTVIAGGLHIYTTLDTDMQKKAEKWVEDTIDEDSDIQAALVSIEPTTGAVKALIGGRDYEESPFNRAINAKRAPGSTFKPFLYYAALENGFTPSTPLLSKETTFHYNDGQDTYTPQNYGRQYADDFITLAQALAVSDNVYAVKTHMLIGEDKLIKAAQQMGITSPLTEIPSLALGTENVGVLEMTNAYATLANNGKRAPAYFIEKVTDADGNVIYEKENETKQVIDEHLSFVTTALMTGIFDETLNSYAQVTGASINHILTRPMAGKSGTTATDSWMIGYSPELVTAVWTGYDKEKKLHPINDTRYAKRIWAQYMEDALRDKPAHSFKPTDGVAGVRIDPHTGKLATDSCPVTRYVYYKKGTEPNEWCADHKAKQEQKQESQTQQKEEKERWWNKLFKWFN